MDVVYFVLVITNGLVAIPVVVFSTEIIASLLPPRARSIEGQERRTFAVVIPAHDEAQQIDGVVRGLLPQLTGSDRLIVVADNCTDATADKARAAGAEVIERNDPEKRGKGYALDFAVRSLASAPPDAVVFVDADCRVSPGSLSVLARSACAHERPMQCLYLMAAPESAPIGVRVAEFAFALKNLARPMGLDRLGLPCQLTGSGMAFPWHIISRANLATGHLAEDMKLGLDLALAGTPARFEPRARVESDFPHSASGVRSQRSRWEEGHIALIGTALRQLPRILKNGNKAALALVLDTLVPPLTLLVLLVTACLATTAILTLILSLPATVLWASAAIWTLLSASVCLAWLCHGRRILPARDLIGIAPFILGKAKLYFSLARGKRSAGWIRTDRKRND